MRTPRENRANHRESCRATPCEAATDLPDAPVPPGSGLRLALVSEHASPLAALGGVDAGGQNVHVAALAQALADRGHEVSVYTRRDDPVLPVRVRLGPRLEVVHVDAGPPTALGKDDLLEHMPAFADVLTADWSVPGRRPDLVHAHFWMSGLASRAAAHRLGVPLAVTFHALGIVKRRWQGSADTSPADRVTLERGLAQDADAVIATCGDEVGELVALGAPVPRLHVVPCGVDRTMFTPFGAAPGRGMRLRLLAVGRLVERKGFDTAIAGLAGLCAGPDPVGAELVIAGGPPAGELGHDPEARRLQALAHRLGVADRVQLLGRVSQVELAAQLRAADVVVVTPVYEPFGLVPLEAMACGRPVVGAAVGGLLDTIEDGENGLLVPSQDPTALAVALRRLAGDEGLRHRLGRAGLARSERYAWPRIAADTEDVYRQLLAHATPGDSLDDRDVTSLATD